jgi:hypothetical protein
MHHNIVGSLPTRLESLAREKHSSLLRTFITYKRKTLITFGP